MTPSLHQACEAFKESYARALREHPEDIKSVDELDEMIHEARAEIGAAAMALSVRAARDVPQTQCSCGGHGVVQRRPTVEVRSAQGRHSVDGLALQCAACGRTWRPVHEMLGVDGQYHSTVLFERFSSDFLLDKGSPAAARRLKEHHGIDVGRTTVLQHAEQRGAEAREFVEQKLQRALEDSDARRAQPLRVAEVFVQMDSSGPSSKTVAVSEIRPRRWKKRHDQAPDHTRLDSGSRRAVASLGGWVKRSPAWSAPRSMGATAWCGKSVAAPWGPSTRRAIP